MPELVRGLRVLVVEDESVLRALCQRILELGGHEAILLESGEAAIEALADDAFAFDLVLSDVLLEGDVDGLAVAEAVCRRRPGTPIIVVSGQHSDDVVARLPSGCPTRFVAKPFTRVEVLGAIDSAWREGVARGSG
jgi:DNA-binding NtrC family response regulator